MKKLASFLFNEIELECDPDPQPCDSVFIFESILTPVSLPNLDQFLEPTFILVSINLEIEPSIYDSHITLMEKECEFYFFDLDPTIEPIPTLEPTLDFLELVMVPELSFLSPSQPFHQVTFFCWI